MIWQGPQAEKLRFGPPGGHGQSSLTACPAGRVGEDIRTVNACHAEAGIDARIRWPTTKSMVTSTGPASPVVGGSPTRPTRSDRRSPLPGADGRVTKCTLLSVLAFLALLFLCSRFKKLLRCASKTLTSGTARPRADNQVGPACRAGPRTTGGLPYGETPVRSKVAGRSRSASGTY